MREWLSLHLRDAGVAEYFSSSAEGPVFWFLPPDSEHARTDLLSHITQHCAHVQSQEVIRRKVRALPAHQYLRLFRSSVATRVLKSVFMSLSGTTLLRSHFKWNIAGLRNAHSIVTATFVHTCHMELSMFATSNEGLRSVCIAGVVQSPRVFCMMLRGCLGKPEVCGP